MSLFNGGTAYEFDGELFNNTNSFLEALAKAYRGGDTETVIDALDEYGFDLSDLGVRPEGA